MAEIRQLASFQDWRSSMLDAVKICFGSPFLFAAVAGLYAASFATPDIASYRGYFRYIDFLLFLAISALIVRTMKYRWSVLSGSQWSASVRDLAVAHKISQGVLLNFVTLWIGLWFLVLPGLFLLLRGCLCCVIACLTKAGMPDSFDASYALTRGHLKTVLKYLWWPVVLLFIEHGLYFIPPFFDPAYGESGAYTHLADAAAHLPFIFACTIVALIVVVTQLSLSAMLVNLYDFCKSHPVKPVEKPRW